jgi:protein O-GlcNAc transferase
LKKKTKKSFPQPQTEASVLQNGERALASGQFDEAIKFFASIAKDSPNYGRACKGHGAALLRLHRLKEALPLLQTAHLALPKDPDILVDGADVARLMGGLDVAADTYSEARKLGATGFQIDFGEASIFQERKQWLKAIEIWEKIDASFPNNPHVLHNLGKAWHELGETDKAVTLMQTAFEIGGETASLVTLALLAPHAGICNHEDVKRIRIKLGERLKQIEGNPPDNINKINHSGRINIGYISAFFHRPNWMKPVWAMLNNHDREKFVIHLFADGAPDKIDQEGGYISHEADKIYDIRKLNNRELAKLISDCEIDVLVDLNSYSATSRLGLWAAKPAPLTIGWFNLYATSGLPGIEWLVGDEVAIHPQEEKFYTEKIVRLNQSYLTFQVKYNTPDVDFPDNEIFTFGCLGSGYKITPEVRAAWIQILQTAKDTRLIVRNKVLDEDAHRKRFLNFFTEAGIEADRIILLGSAEHHEFLQTYGKIDLALDTFPYNGGTTTTEAIWQGVPVVCFSGDRWISRTSATILHFGELNQFIGANVNEYIDLAVKWSAPEQRATLRNLRQKMREKLKNSKVCDGAGLAKNFEEIVFEIKNQNR